MDRRKGIKNKRNVLELTSNRVKIYKNESIHKLFILCSELINNTYSNFKKALVIKKTILVVTNLN